MALTRDFRETVVARAKRDKAFRHALFIEALELFLEGDISVGKSVLRSFINATIGFDELSKKVSIPSKSLMRMFSTLGNPTISSFFEVIATLQKKEALNFEVKIKNGAISDTGLISSGTYSNAPEEIKKSSVIAFRPRSSMPSARSGASLYRM